MKKILVLCSGGLKSAFLLGLAVRERAEVHAVYVHHGQANDKKALEATKKLCNYYQAQLHQLELPNLWPGWPPFKMTLLLWVGFLEARRLGCHLVYYGPSKDDFNKEATLQYLDILQTFIDTVQPKYDKKGFLRSDVIQVESPTMLLEESKIIILGNYYHVPWHLSWCCESDKNIHCGTCFECRRRQTAFKTAHDNDPTTYIRHMPETTPADASAVTWCKYATILREQLYCVFYDKTCDKQEVGGEGCEQRTTE